MRANKLKKLKRLLPEKRACRHNTSATGDAVVEILEPRTLFSADLLGIGYLEEHPIEPTEVQPPSFVDDALPLELVVIDAAVVDYEQLLADFNAARETGRNLQIHALDPDKDGMEQLSLILRGNENVISGAHFFPWQQLWAATGQQLAQPAQHRITTGHYGAVATGAGR